MKLGKLAARQDRRTLHMIEYLTRALPPLQPVCNWAERIPAWTMGGNDQVGDCTCVAAANMVDLWRTLTAKQPPIIPTVDILSAYSAVTGYNPADPATDQGAVVLDVLNYWRNVGIGGDRLGAYLAIEPTHTTHLQYAVSLFGAAYIGLLLPLSAQDQINAGRAWTVPACCAGQRAAPGSWGGHAVPIVGYDQFGVTLVTWARTQKASWPFLAKYCDEAYACLSADWIADNGQAPSGIDLPTLQADLAQIAA